MLPESTRNALSITLGSKNLQLCTKGGEHCFRSRAVAMAAKYPGIAISSYDITVALLDTPVIISNNQFLYVINSIAKEKTP